jgi:hypothetical protein
MNPPTASATTRFALAQAQINLALQPFAFELRAAPAPGLLARVLIEPLGLRQVEGQTANAYRRSVVLERDGLMVSRTSSVNYIDLESGLFIANQSDAFYALARSAKPLPAAAVIGQSARYFDTHAYADVSKLGSPVISQVTWSLEPQPGTGPPRALWCNHIQSANGPGLDSAECYVIDTTGQIFGAVIRAQSKDRQLVLS